jgi:hypothetical protein
MKKIEFGRFDEKCTPAINGPKSRIWSNGLPKEKSAERPLVTLNEKDNPQGLSIEKMLGAATLHHTGNDDVEKYLAAMSTYNYDPATNIGFREFIARIGIHKIERTLRTKSALDETFFYTNHACLGEAFRFAEFSKNKQINVFDVNSMFPWIVKTAKFPDPSKLLHSQSPELLDHLKSEKLDNGIFKVHLSYKPEHHALMSKFAPMFFGHEGGSAPVAQMSGEVFETWLHQEELLQLLSYCNIEVLEGIYSEKSISHPLAPWVDKFYERKRSQDPIEKIVAKAALTTLHTCASRVSKQLLRLHPDNVQAEFLKRFQSRPFISGRYAQLIEEMGNGTQIWQMYNVKKPANIYSLAATVYGAARARMLELLIAIDSIEGASVCYTNIDSIHVSSTPAATEQVLATIEKIRGIGPNLGQMKIEATGDTAMWLDAGVYWIGKAGTLIKHAALAPEPENAFATKFPFTATDLETGLEYQGWTHLFKSLSLAKKLIGNHWVRLSVDEVKQGSLENALRRVKELEKIKPAFDKIRHTLKAPC